MKKKKFFKTGRKNFPPKRNFQRSSEGPSEPINVDSISSRNIGKTFTISGIIDRIVQTAGPTVFHLTDGTGNLPLKGFEGAGERAHKEIQEGDYIEARIKVEEFNKALEGEIIHIKKLEGKEKEKVAQNMEEIEKKRAELEPPEFLIKSKILDKLKPEFIKAAIEIRLAVIQNRPIIVRHHNDADGYSSGYALEKAIIPLIQKQHGAGKAPWEYFTRAPCAAPFYEIDDSIRDTANSLSDAAKFSNKMPLIIIADNGSSQEDLLGIQQGKVHGMQFIVVDHHFFEKDVISSEVLVHINPFLVEEDGSHFSAGMLCTELARFISPVKNIEQIAAMAGLADRIDNPQAIDAYLKLAEKQGYSKKLLQDIATVIDFVSAKLRFMEAREYIEVLFGEPMDKQKKLVNLLAPHIRELELKGLEIAKSAVKLEKEKSTIVQLLEIESTFPRGFYPKPGKVTGIIHDYKKEQGNKAVVTLGIMPDAITMRATDEANFSVHSLIEHLNKNLPQAFVQGGGHKNAGAISFVPQHQKEIIEQTKKFIESRAR